MMRILILTALYITLATPAYAYIEVALGSLILQGLLAGFVTLAVMWRNWIKKVKRFFKMESATEEQAQTEIPVED